MCARTYVFMVACQARCCATLRRGWHARRHSRAHGHAAALTHTLTHLHAYGHARAHVCTHTHVPAHTHALTYTRRRMRAHAPAHLHSHTLRRSLLHVVAALDQADIQCAVARVLGGPFDHRSQPQALVGVCNEARSR